MLNFCTLFNKNYFSRGIAMYNSLLEHNKNICLYVFAFDDETYQALSNLKLPSLVPVSLKDFEDEKLLAIKDSRSAGEYCWTCTPSTILYCLKKFSLTNCTYVDADLYFFSDPLVLIEEAGEKSVIITEHRYTSYYDQSKISGTYCVQFMYFKNNEDGLRVLEWWRERCLEWCYSYVEDGKFGDQMYLEDWLQRFKGVHVMKHLGGGLAPWNVQQYTFKLQKGQLSGTEISSGKQFNAVFYHFHRFKFYKGGIAEYTAPEYAISRNVKKYIYEPYLKALESVRKNYSQLPFDIHGTSPSPAPEAFTAKSALKYYLRDLFEAFRLILGRELKARKMQTHIHQYKK